MVSNNILISRKNNDKISVKNSGVYSALFTLQGSDASENCVANYNVNLTSQIHKTYYITVKSMKMYWKDLLFRQIMAKH